MTRRWSFGTRSVGGSSADTNTKGEEMMFDSMVREATAKMNVCLYVVASCGDCCIVTNSGGRFGWIVGRLDDRETLFVEKIGLLIDWGL